MNNLNYNVNYRIKDKGWQCIVSYKDDLGKWKQKSKQGFKTKKEAKAYSNIIIKELETKQELNFELKEITLKEFIDTFLDHSSLYKEENTLGSYKYALNKLRNLYNKELSKITTLDLQKIFDNLAKQNIKNSSMKMIKSKISFMFNTAVNQYNIIENNPVNKVVINSKDKSEEKRSLTLKELNDLINKTNSIKYKLFIAICGMCGLRRGEASGLTWDNIDFINNTLTIDKQWKRLKTGWGLGECKTSNSYRTVPFNSTVRKLLIEYKGSYPINIDNRIFSFINMDNLSTSVYNCIRKAGYDVTVHELRHTFATILIQNNVDFKTAAKLLGHDVEQTMNTYSHVNDEMLERAKNVIQKFF